MRWKERSVVGALYGVDLKNEKTGMDMMLILGLNEAICQLVVANSVHWYGHVLRREDGHILRRVKVKGRKREQKADGRKC